jgi:ATP-binding cassette subfamily B protein
MQELFTSILVVIFKDALLLLGITFMLIGIDWRLALVSLSVVPFVVFISFRFSTMIRDAFRSLRVLIARINTRFAETVGGISVIQTFLWEDKNEATFAGLNHAFYQAGIRQLTIFALFLPIIEVFGSISIALVVFYGGWRVTGKALSLGELVAFISYLKMFFRPIREIAERYNIMQNAMASAERIFQILDTPDSIPRHERISPYPSRTDTPDRIRFESVTFGYSSDTPVLKSVTLDIPAGSTYAVVGPTGAGKTSLINLLVRFYDPWSGVVRINDTDIRTLDLAELRAAVALVPQDPFLFSGTIRDNIFITRLRPGPAETTDILARSRVDTIVNRLPDGLDTPIGEGGAAFSSGERQLISIARAFAKNPRIILLDEATSYIDAESEEKIRQALLDLTAERTTIQVAHRISTARRADAVAVVAGGRIVETGTHAELINSGGLYATLSSTG